MRTLSLLLSLLLLAVVTDARWRRRGSQGDSGLGTDGGRWRWGRQGDSELGRPSQHGSWWRRLFGNNGNSGDWPWGGRHHFDFGDTGFNFGFSWPMSRQKDWWEGPNVCHDEDTANSTDAGTITHHYRAATQVCEESDAAYKCTSTVQTPQGKITKTEVYECCHGYTRQPGDFGCPERLQLRDLASTALTLGLTDFLTAVNATGLAEELSRGNFTVFAPVNDAFPLPPLPEGTGLTLQADQPQPNVIMVSDDTLSQIEQDLQTVLLGHVLPQPRKASTFSDEEVLVTGSPVDSTVRINFYSSPEKLTTANCVRVTSTDNMATNGVIHTVEKVLPTVTSSLLEVIQREEQFSTLKTALARANLVSTLKTEGQWTLFAPTDAAFKALDNKLLDRLLSGDPKCLQKVLKQHLLPNVICSPVIQGRAKSRNALDNFVNLTRTDDGKVFVDDAQVVRADVMATNGVIHVIDAVLVPEDALDLVTVAKKSNLTELVKLVQLAGLTSTLQNANNVTVFAPSNEAIQALPQEVVQQLTSDPAKLERVLTYHVVPEELSSRQLFNGRVLNTLNVEGQLQLNEYSSFPFRHDHTLTVQCANVIARNVPACNGIVHVIDKVMIPPTGNVVDVLAADKRYSTLVRLVKIAGLADSLQAQGPFTVFAPTNQAFDKLGKETLAALEGDLEQLTEVLKLHVIQGTLCCGGIFKTSWWHQQRVRTIGGQSLSLARDRVGVPFVNDAAIGYCDNLATNGVVQGISDVLMQRPDPWYTFP